MTESWRCPLGWGCRAGSDAFDLFGLAHKAQRIAVFHQLKATAGEPAVLRVWRVWVGTLADSFGWSTLQSGCPVWVGEQSGTAACVPLQLSRNCGGLLVPERPLPVAGGLGWGRGCSEWQLWDCDGGGGQMSGLPSTHPSLPKDHNRARKCPSHSHTFTPPCLQRNHAVEKHCSFFCLTFPKT